MNTIKLMALPFTFLAGALMLGGCVGAEPIEGDEALAVQAEPEQETAEAAALTEAAPALDASFESVRADGALDSSAVAPAPPTSDAAAPACLSPIQISRSGTIINGSVYFNGCGGGPGTADLRIQRSRWFGWEDMKIISNVSNSDGWRVITYNCAGTGTHDFRVFLSGETVGAGPWSKSSSTIRVSC